MNRQQQLLFTMLAEIKDICERNDITYFIGFGTLIGAMRNEGFLPWDDDIDVIMSYDNWVKFQQACETQLPPNRYLGSADADPEYGHLLPRYISTDTTAIHTAQSLNDAVSGELIDIFILDPISDDPADYDAYRRDLYLYTTLINYANVSAYRMNLDPELFKTYLDREKTEGVLPVRQEVAAQLASHHSEVGENYAFRWQGAPVLFKRWWFEKPVPVSFEGLTVNAPQGISEYLTFYYGEEWPEVPGDIAPAKHNTAASLDFPYTEALEYFHPKFDRDELLHTTEERRYLVLQNAPASNRQNDDIVRAKAAVVKHELEQRIASNRSAFDKACAERDIEALEPILHDYLSAQISQKFIGRNSDKGYYRYINPVLIDVPDPVFEAGLWVLMGTHHIRHAHMLLDKRTMLGLADTPSMAQARDAITRFNRACDDYQFGRYQQGLETAENLSSAHPFVDAFLKLKIMFLAAIAQQQPTSQNLRALEDAAESGRRTHPADGFYLKYLGDVSYARGDEDAGRTRYLQAAEMTRNGLVLLDISKKTGYFPTWLRNPAWAKEAGVPQWDQPLPAPPSDARPPKRPAEPDERQVCATRLLAEVGGLCDSLDIPYILGPATLQALSTQGQLPATLDSWQVVLQPQDALKLKEHLLAHPNSRRPLQYLGNSERILTGEMRYHAADTLALDLKKDSPNGFNSLYVRILPLEPAAGLPEPLKSQLAARTKRITHPPHGRKAKLKATIKGILHPEPDGDALFTRMMQVSTGAPAAVRFAKKPIAFDPAFLTNRETCQFGEWTFSVPVATDQYLKAMTPEKEPKQLKLTDSMLCSAHMSYQELVDEKGLDPAFFERRDTLVKAQKREREILRDFRFNFQQIKLAVETKKLAQALLPRKDELLALGAQKDWEALGTQLKRYRETAQKYKKYGACNFDDDLFALMNETAKHVK